MTFDVSQESYLSLRSVVAERTSRLLAWVGSGLSAPSGLPTWRTLKSRLEEALKNKADTLDPKESVKLLNMVKTIQAMSDIWTSFELLRTYLGAATWRSTIREVLNVPPTTVTPDGYAKIWNLNVHGILNLNLDRFATKAYIETVGIESPIEFNGNKVGNYTHILKGPRQFVCNLHGQIEDTSSWVLTKSELKNLLNDSAYSIFMHNCIASNTIIFLGTRIDDISVGGFLEGLTKLGVDFGEHYWVTDRNDLETDNFAERVGVRVIRYNAPGGDHSELSEFFEDLLKYVSPEDEIKQPAFIRITESENVDLPDAKDILQLDTEDIREYLNNKANHILYTPSLEAYKTYEEFSEEYDEAIYRSWYTSTKPGSNILCGYQLDNEKAFGAFGKVFHAKAPNGHEVAIKVLHEEIRHNKDLLHSFRRGVHSMSILSEHKVDGMVPYIDASEIPAFVVMDWIKGPSLKEAVESKQIEDWSTILRIASSITSIVRRGHVLPERVLHRDLRPSNIMLKDYYADPTNWKVVVLDFDLSWYRGSFEKSIVHGSTLMGYLAPEQIQAKSGVSTRHTAVDSFGLGMTLYFMCSGRNPLPDEHLHPGWDETVTMATNKIQQCTWHSLSNRYSRLIHKATSDNQKDRWDMAQIESELLRLQSAIDNPNSIESSELIAEEIAARCHFMDGYLWDDDKLAAVKETASGINIQIQGDESNGCIRVSLAWGIPGVRGRESLGKYIIPAMEAAESILKGNGWKIDLSENRYASIIIKAHLATKKALASLSTTCNIIERAIDRLRFD